jgi:hypothetical protein
VRLEEHGGVAKELNYAVRKKKLDNLYPQKVGANFADKLLSLGP